MNISSAEQAALATIDPAAMLAQVEKRLAMWSVIGLVALVALIVVLKLL